MPPSLLRPPHEGVQRVRRLHGTDEMVAFLKLALVLHIAALAVCSGNAATLDYATDCELGANGQAVCLFLGTEPLSLPSSPLLPSNTILQGSAGSTLSLAGYTRALVNEGEPVFSDAASAAMLEPQTFWPIQLSNCAVRIQLIWLLRVNAEAHANSCVVRHSSTAQGAC